MARREGFDDQTDLRPDRLRYRADSAGRCLVVSWRDGAGEHSAAVTQRTVVGSAPGVGLQVQDPAVSRLHAELEPAGDGHAWVRDLGSRNGTYVDGIQVTGARVPDGARIRVGATELHARYGAAPAATAPPWPSDRFGPLVGPSDVMRRLFAQLDSIARTRSAVLITGETGTGKELVAQAVHEASPRAGKPFVTVDCAALPESLLEAELFGHAKGAFTGAVGARAGAFEEADGGTVFLDEIGELPLAMQPKLLRVTESCTVRRLGEAGYKRVDVRFVCATHRDLRRMVNAGTFREDLYFRLAVLPVEVPPLRARVGDIPALVERFLPPGQGGGLDPALVRELEARPWPGNVRELRNFVERAVAVGARQALEMGSATAPQPRGESAAGEGLPAVPLDRPLREVRERWLTHLEREYIRGIIARHGGNISLAADAAGLNRTYLHRLMRKYDV